MLAELAPRGCVSLGSQAENGDGWKRQAKEKADRNAARTSGSARARLAGRSPPLLDRELCRLPDTYRAAVICCDLQGCSRTDAARQLGWPEGTLKVRLMRARSILARRLTQQGVALSAGTLAVVLSHKAASAAVPAALLSSTAKAAGAVAATSGVSTSAGAKTATLVKGVVKSLYVGKTAVAAAAGRHADSGTRVGSAKPRHASATIRHICSARGCRAGPQGECTATDSNQHLPVRFK